jgi:hypothetical protein
MFLLGLLLHDRVVQVFQRPQHFCQPRHHRGRRCELSALPRFAKPSAEVVVANLQGNRTSLERKSSACQINVLLAERNRIEVELGSRSANDSRRWPGML